MTRCGVETGLYRIHRPRLQAYSWSCMIRLKMGKTGEMHTVPSLMHTNCFRFDSVLNGTSVLMQYIAPDLPARQGPYLRSSSKAVSRIHSLSRWGLESLRAPFQHLFVFSNKEHVWPQAHSSVANTSTRWSDGQRFLALEANKSPGRQSHITVMIRFGDF